MGVGRGRRDIFLHFSMLPGRKGTCIPLSTEARSPTLGETHTAFPPVTYLHRSTGEGVTNLTGQSPRRSEG